MVVAIACLWPTCRQMQFARKGWAEPYAAKPPWSLRHKPRSLTE